MIIEPIANRIDSFHGKSVLISGPDKFKPNKAKVCVIITLAEFAARHAIGAKPCGPSAWALLHNSSLLADVLVCSSVIAWCGSLPRQTTT